MPTYRVRLAGSGFEKTVDGIAGTYGFYVNCFLEAATPEEAGANAIGAISKRGDLREQLARPMRAAVVVDEIAEWTDATMPSPQGLVWFPQD